MMTNTERLAQYNHMRFVRSLKKGDIVRINITEPWRYPNNINELFQGKYGIILQGRTYNSMFYSDYNTTTIYIKLDLPPVEYDTYHFRICDIEKPAF